MKAFASLTIVVLLAGAAACARAGGEVSGGEVTEAGALANTEGEFTGDPFPGDTSDSAPVEGTKWSELYRDYFGATELNSKGERVPRAGSCSFKSNCHGSPEGAGAKSKGGIRCFNEKDCYRSITTPPEGAARAQVEPIKDREKPADAFFLGTLKSYRPNKVGDPVLRGIMPKEPGGYYSAKAIARVTAWIAAGAPE